jgi:hypothetical protein
MLLSVEAKREMVPWDELIKVFREISDFEEMKAARRGTRHSHME